MSRLLFSITLIILIAACQSAQTNSDVNNDSAATDRSAADTTNINAAPLVRDTNSLAGQWFLMAVLASDTAAGKIPEINFNLNAGSFAGNTGCNRMSGKFQKTDSTIVFDKSIITTKMACTGYNEQAFLQNLLRVNRYRFDSNMLILLADGVEVSKWTRKPERGPKTQKA